MASWQGALAEIERVKSERGRARVGGFSIEGLRLHERALRAEAPLRHCLIGRELAASRDPRVERLVAELALAGAPPLVAPDEALEAITEGRDVGALVGLVEIPRPPELERLLQASSPTLLVGHDVEDPGNVGALVRTALAAGCVGYLRVGAGDPYHPRAVRTSMGSLFKLPLLRLDDAARRLAELGVRQFAAVASGGEDPWSADLDGGAVALWMGSEAVGLPADLVAELDGALTLPMPAGVDSLSVNAAASALLFERCRRRFQVLD